MSELENRLDKARKRWQKSLLMEEEAVSELGKNSARTNATDHKNYIDYLEMLISDAHRLAMGEEISLVVRGTFKTWVENSEELWDLVFDHALQVKDGFKEADVEAELDALFV